MRLGRNFDEIYRALIAMQTSDKFNVATPADWYPGDDVIISPAGSCGVAEERMTNNDELECEDWFFCTKKLDKEKVLSSILKNPDLVLSNWYLKMIPLKIMLLLQNVLI